MLETTRADHQRSAHPILNLGHRWEALTRSEPVRTYWLRIRSACVAQGAFKNRSRRRAVGAFLLRERKSAPTARRRLRCCVALLLILSCRAPSAQAFTFADADSMWRAHAKAFYREQDGQAWFLESTDGGKASYWMRAEQMEMVLDAYERTTNAQLLVMFTNLFRGFLADHGTKWAHNGTTMTSCGWSSPAPGPIC